VRRTLGLVFGCWLLFSAGWTVGPRAQGLPPQTRLVAVDVVGLQRLAKADVVAALGLKIGASITVADLEAAAERLAKSGVVSEVSFRYAFRGPELTATYTVVEARARTVVVFDNFPWFTDDELIEAVGARVPGFAGWASDSSQGVDEIARALSGILEARALPGKVEYFPHLDAATGTTSHLFKVTGVSLPICALDFRGVEGGLDGGVRRESAPLLSREYSRNGSFEFLRAALTPFYRRRGHLQVKVLGVSGRVGVKGSTCQGGVALTASVAEGLTYAWKGANWTGNQAVITADLDKLLGMKAGAPADGVQFDDGLKAAARAYGRVGHLLVSLRPAPRFDDPGRTVTFDVAVDEGPQFVMGAFSVQGAPDEAVRRLRELWKLKAGDVYDEDYPTRFVAEVGKSEGPFLPRLGRLNISTAPNVSARTVDVTFVFGSQGGEAR
jgi:hypothetical protein